MAYLRALLAALLLAGLAWPEGPVPDKEYQVKAVFLYNFTQFVDWPAASFPEPSTPLVVGVLGNDPFGDYLDEVVRGEKAGGHPIVVERYHRLEEVKNCQVLFVGASELPRIDAILAGLKTHCVLTVGESDAFTRRGGMVGFVTRAGKIHLLINLEAAKAAGLNVSSKLLRISEVSRPEGR